LDSSLHLDGTGGEDALRHLGLDIHEHSSARPGSDPAWPWVSKPNPHLAVRGLSPYDIGGYRSCHSSIGWDVTQGLAFFWISGLAFYEC